MIRHKTRVFLFNNWPSCIKIRRTRFF